MRHVFKGKRAIAESSLYTRERERERWKDLSAGPGKAGQGGISIDYSHTHTGRHVQLCSSGLSCACLVYVEIVVCRSAVLRYREYSALLQGHEHIHTDALVAHWSSV